MIHIIRVRATKQQLDEMLETLGVYVKLAVDIRRGILAGGGPLHADCEAALVDEGSHRKIFGERTGFHLPNRYANEALINIQPYQNNPSMTILDPSLCSQINEIVQGLLGGV